MSGVQEAIAILDATPVEDLVQRSYIERDERGHSCRCAIGVLASAAGVSDAVLRAFDFLRIGNTSKIAHPVIDRFGLRTNQLSLLQEAFDDAPDPATGKAEALELLRSWS